MKNCVCSIALSLSIFFSCSLFAMEKPPRLTNDEITALTGKKELLLKRYMEEADIVKNIIGDATVAEIRKAWDADTWEQMIVHLDNVIARRSKEYKKDGKSIGRITNNNIVITILYNADGTSREIPLTLPEFLSISL